jgi:SAM-dependent methyltransferase
VVYDKLRRLVRRNRHIYEAVKVFKYGPHIGFRNRSVRRALIREGIERGWLMLNLGSGGRRHPAMINLDLLPVTGPDVVADAFTLPFRPQTFDAIFCDSVIEHVAEPERFLVSIAATLKPSGILYLEVPFLQPMHGLPHDFTRWTKQGFRAAAARAGLTVTACDVEMGPGFAMFWLLTDWLALLLSFGSAPIQATIRYLLRWLLAPIMLADLLFRHIRFSEALASSFFFVVRPEKTRNAGAFD